MEWIVNNKEWLFSGLLVAVPIAIISWLFVSKSMKQNQKGGNNSTNIQIGGDFKVNNKRDDKDVK